MREFIADLSPEWQEKIGLKVSRGIWTFFEEDYYEEMNVDLEELDDDNLVCDATPTADDPDLPEIAAGGHVEDCVGQMNPGQLVLAMAEKVQELGGRIGTSCEV